MQRGQIDVGQIVAGKYELLRLLGKGAMGEVWLARHGTLGGEFAIKLVRPEAQEADESAIARFQQEAQVSAKLSRKTRHIVSVSDHGEDQGLAYLVMEALEGESLDARITRDGQLDLPETAAIVTQIARALGQAHAEQIVHRDLKPANVFLTQDEDGRLLVKLLDFGIARANSPGNKRSPFATGKDMVLGTPSYMSPEQARGLETLDHRGDLWALAVVAYEMLTGTIPWQGETIEDIFLNICTHEWTPILSRRADLPSELESFFARAFAEKLNARFKTAAELSEAFVALAGPLGIDAVRAAAPSSPELHVPQPVPSAPDTGPELLGVSVGGTTTRRRKRRASVAWVVAAVVGLAMIGILGLALVAVTAPDKAKVKSAPPEPTTVNPVPPPQPATATATAALVPAEPTAVATATTKSPAHPIGRPARTAPGASPPAPATAATPATPATLATPATPVTPPAVTAPPPAPPASARPPPDKSQVF